MQVIRLNKADKGVSAIVEGKVEISEAERARIAREWEKPENKSKLEQLIGLYGEYKMITDSETGVAYKVPTRDIITKGIRQQDLNKYPLWQD